MELQLKNIGMIKEANVKIDGLTVIAGENDTGKSTVGKVLFTILNSLKNIRRLNTNDFDVYQSQYYLNYYFVFREEARDNCYMGIEIDGLVFDFSYFKKENNFNKIQNNINDIVFIESPLVWSFTDFFRDIAQIESQMRIELDYPYLMKDLNFKLHIKSALDGLDIKEKVTSLMGGEFKKDEMGRYYFDKKGQRIELVNTATGIKYFGIFQVLSQNNYLNENTVLVLDEPEVHLHPKWQLEMAKIIVELVQNGIKIVVNSHSPYMIQALIKYARDKDIVDKSNFYLTQKNGDYASIDNVNDELNKIFELLAKPMNEVFEL